MRNIDFTQVAPWAHGLFAASITAGATTGAALLSSYAGAKIDWRQLGISLGVSSLMAAFFYLKNSPLPGIPVITISPPPASTTTLTINNQPEKS